MDLPKERFGRLVKDLREGRGWNRYRLSDKTGIPYGTLANYERGRHAPPLDRMVKIANAFGFSLADLCNEIEL